MKKLLLGILTLSLLSSCSHTLFHTETLVSTKSMALPEYKDMGAVSVRKCATIVLRFGSPLNYKKMYQYAMEDATNMGGDAIVDFQVAPDGFTFIYPLFIRDCWVAKGRAAKFKSGSSSWDSPKEESKGSSKWDKTDSKSINEKPKESKWEK